MGSRYSRLFTICKGNLDIKHGVIKKPSWKTPCLSTCLSFDIAWEIRGSSWWLFHDWLGLQCRSVGGTPFADLGGGESVSYMIWRELLIKVFHTNRRNIGWTSADRSTKATLMLTVPSSIFKSSTKDLTWPTLVISSMIRCWPEGYRYTRTSVKVSIVICQHGFWLRGVQS